MSAKRELITSICYLSNGFFPTLLVSSMNTKDQVDTYNVASTMMTRSYHSNSSILTGSNGYLSVVCQHQSNCYYHTCSCEDICAEYICHTGTTETFIESNQEKLERLQPPFLYVFADVSKLIIVNRTDKDSDISYRYYDEGVVYHLIDCSEVRMVSMKDTISSNGSSRTSTDDLNAIEKGKRYDSSFSSNIEAWLHGKVPNFKEMSTLMAALFSSSSACDRNTCTCMVVSGTVKMLCHKVNAVDTSNQSYLIGKRGNVLHIYISHS